MNLNSPGVPEVFLPPVNRSMRILDKSFFKKIIPLSALTVFEDRNLSRVRMTLQKAGDLLSINPIKPVRPDETTSGHKCILLRPGIESSGEVQDNVLEFLSHNLFQIPQRGP